jgi:hypothetical protein
VHKDQKVIKVRREHKVIKGIREHRVPLALKVHRAIKVFKAQPERKATKVIKAHKAHKAIKVRPVRKDQKAYRVRRVHRVPLALKVLKVLKVFKALRVTAVVMPECLGTSARRPRVVQRLALSDTTQRLFLALPLFTLVKLTVTASVVQRSLTLGTIQQLQVIVAYFTLQIQMVVPL